RNRQLDALLHASVGGDPKQEATAPARRPHVVVRVEREPVRVALTFGCRVEDAPVGERSALPIVVADEDASAGAARPIKAREVGRERHPVGDAGAFPEAHHAAVALDAIKAAVLVRAPDGAGVHATFRSEEHTSELQSRENLVCRLLLEKKKKKKNKRKRHSK